tara:strand:+ start:545 stop:787 length:243 start_codon:yes stop_codon:yes gene_type:complete
MFKVKLLKYNKMWWTKELVGVMNIDEAEKYISENQENSVIYRIIRLSSLQSKRVKELGKEKVEQMIRNQINDFYTPMQYR